MAAVTGAYVNVNDRRGDGLYGGGDGTGIGVEESGVGVGRRDGGLRAGGGVGERFDGHGGLRY